MFGSTTKSFADAFKAPESSTSISTASSFGQPSASTATSSFGQPSASTATSSFGQPSTSTSSTTPTPSFGQPSTSTTTPSFGQPSTSTSSTIPASSFGQPTASTATPTPSFSSTPSFTPSLSLTPSNSTAKCEAFDNKAVKTSKDPALMDKFVSKLMDNHDPRIVYLRHLDLIKWLFGDVSFLGPKQCDPEIKEKMEDDWGKKLTGSDDWCTKISETVFDELCYLNGDTPITPPQKGDHCPTVENTMGVFFLYSSPYFSDETSDVFSGAFRYDEVPTLYGKPLYIMGFGGAENDMEKSKMIGEKVNKTIISAFVSNKIIFTGISRCMI
jgi:hypothetical protein